MTTKSQDISDVLTHEGIDKLKAGQILIFDYEGTRNELKITKINKKSHKAWAIPIKTYGKNHADLWVSLRDAVKAGQMAAGLSDE